MLNDLFLLFMKKKDFQLLLLLENLSHHVQWYSIDSVGSLNQLLEDPTRTAELLKLVIILMIFMCSKDIVSCIGSFVGNDQFNMNHCEHIHQHMTLMLIFHPPSVQVVLVMCNLNYVICKA